MTTPHRPTLGALRRPLLAATALAALATPLLPVTAAQAAGTADIGVTLTAGSTDLPGKGETTLTVTVTNNGGDWTPYNAVVHIHGTATSRMWVTDPRCASQDSWGVDQAPGNVGFGCATADPLAPGGSATFTLNYQADPAGGDDQLTAGTEFTADVTPNDDTGTLTVHAAPYVPHVDLAATLTAGATAAAPGDVMTGTAVVTNAGPDAPQNGHLSVTASEPVTFSPASLPDGVSCTGGAALTCELGIVWVNEPAAVPFTLVAPPRAPGSSAPVTLTESLTSDAQETAPSDNTATAVVAVTAPAQADLGVTVTAPAGGVRVGGMSEWDITASNSGPNAATADVTLSFPNGLNPLGGVGVDPPVTVGGITTLTWHAGTLAAGESRVYRLLSAPSSAGVYAITATVASATLDPQPANNSATSAAVTVTPRTYADIRATVTAPAGTQYPAQAGTWTVAAGNAGPDSGSSGLTATFPAGLVPTATDGALVTTSGGITTLTWPVRNIAAGETMTHHVTAVAGALGSYQVTASVGPVYLDGTIDPNLANNTASASVTAVQVPLTVTVAAPAAAQWSDQTPVDVTVTAANKMRMAGTTVTVSAYGRTYIVKAGTDGHARLYPTASYAPGNRTTITASVTGNATYRAASGSATVTVAKEDAQLWQAPTSGRYRTPTTVTLRLLDSTAPGYSGPRREAVSTATRADVTRSVLAVRIYYGSTLVAAYNQRPISIGNGIGQTSVRFTPTHRGTYTVVTSAYPGSWSSFATLTARISVR